jgi:hypothetical protein
MESLCADLPRNLDLIAIAFVYLCIKFHESKHC